MFQTRPQSHDAHAESPPRKTEGVFRQCATLVEITQSVSRDQMPISPRSLVATENRVTGMFFAVRSQHGTPT